MANGDLPYLAKVGNIGAILDKIQGAGTPPKFTLEFLKTLGFNSSQDRGFPRVLKQLGLLTQDGVPTPRYNEFKSTTAGGLALAEGLREGWAPIFLADQTAYQRSSGELKEIFKTVTGSSDSVAEKMASTFKSLAGKADWSGPGLAAALTEGDGGGAVGDSAKVAGGQGRRGVSLHHDVHIHLPPTSDVSVYKAIFRALREELM